MREIRIDHKVTDFAYVLIQDEKNISTLVFMPPTQFWGVDISNLDWEVKAVNLSADSFYLTSLASMVDGDRLRIPWTVDENYTGQDGDLCVTLTGRQADEIRAKFQIQGIEVKKECDATAEMRPDYFADVLAQTQVNANRAETAAGEAEAAAQALAQAGINFRILGYFATLAELEAAIADPVIGDAYLIGDNPSTLYIWTGNQWAEGQQISIDVTLFMQKSIYDPPAPGETKGPVELAGGILNAVYPVGSIYMSVNNTNPSTLFGGTWSAWGSGRVPVGVNTSDTDFNTSEKTGGSKTNTLVLGNLPNIYAELVVDASKVRFGPSGTGNGISSGGTYGFDPATGTALRAHIAGSSTPITNLQPYITCYMWKRTA